MGIIFFIDVNFIDTIIPGRQFRINGIVSSGELLPTQAA